MATTYWLFRWHVILNGCLASCRNGPERWPARCLGGVIGVPRCMWPMVDSTPSFTILHNLCYQSGRFAPILMSLAPVKRISLPILLRLHSGRLGGRYYRKKPRALARTPRWYQVVAITMVPSGTPSRSDAGLSGNARINADRTILISAEVVRATTIHPTFLAGIRVIAN